MAEPLTHEQGMLLGDALRKLLVHINVIRADAGPTGPELLAIVEDVVSLRGGEWPAQDDPLARTHAALSDVMGLFGHDMRANCEIVHKYVEVLQKNQKDFGFPITASFNKENWNAVLTARKTHLERLGLKYTGPEITEA